MLLLSKLHIPLLILSLAIFSPLYSTIIDKQEQSDFSFYKNESLSFQGSYEAQLVLLKEMSPSEEKEKQELFSAIDYLANMLKQCLANVIISHANIIALFPAEGPTAKLSLAIELAEGDSPSEFLATKTYRLSATGKQNLNPEEEEQYDQFTSECETLSLQGCDILLDLLTTYGHLLHFNLNECPIAIDLELSIRQPKE